jgi:hypothetical protein
VIFEDLHWIDGEPQALLEGLVDSLGSARLLLLVNSPGIPARLDGQDLLQPAPAGRLAPEACRPAGCPPRRGFLLAPLKRLLVRRGNPFFVEESVRTLAETKVLAGELDGTASPADRGDPDPTTVRTMLAADRSSPPEEKRLSGRVRRRGKDVPLRLLQSVADMPPESLQGGLAHLQAAEFLYQVERSDQTPNTLSSMRDDEVTYGGLLQERRRELHARIVDAIETLHADRLIEHVERLAHHAYRGALGPKAVHHLRQAGLKAAGRSALEEARTWLEQALGILKDLPKSEGTDEQTVDISLELAAVLPQLGDNHTVLARLREAESLAESLSDDPRICRVFMLMADTYTRLGDRSGAVETATHALNVAWRLGDSLDSVFSPRVILPMLTGTGR